MVGQVGSVMLLREKDTYVPETVRELILEALRSRRFSTVQGVVTELKSKGVPENITMRMIKDLAQEGSVLLNLPGSSEETVMTPVSSWFEYLGSTLALDLWLTLVLLILGLVTTLLIPVDLWPTVVLRWIFGGLLLVLVPGFALVRALFPFERFIDRWERLALSCGLSVALAVLVGFGLNFTPWGITLVPTAIVLTIITLASILIATYRRARILISPSIYPSSSDSK
ncbi:MAG: DUF1616 domain-containing protein [Candidatus Odinarchaeota archaeon]